MTNYVFYVVLALATLANVIAPSPSADHKMVELAVETLDHGTTEDKRNLRASVGGTTPLTSERIKLLHRLQVKVLPDLAGDARDTMKKRVASFIDSDEATKKLMKHYGIDLERVIYKMHFLHNGMFRKKDPKKLFYMALGSEYYKHVAITNKPQNLPKSKKAVVNHSSKPTGFEKAGIDINQVMMKIEWLRLYEKHKLTDIATTNMALGSEYIKLFVPLYPKLRATTKPKRPADASHSANLKKRSYD
ncbi:hypothetical protein PsorP6_016350 [Peronosclerospora sorghi]|uniref:Uncharacterized protein n=1 Tax=Peronosclerospora sorghi TaxID=230839 RepID=A0ACC0VLX3_9STRA|nr:hypothetical protein PsorP6_016350 [Peronosclerospora sorghi]